VNRPVAVVVVVLAACASAPPPRAPAPARARIDVATTTCPHPVEANARLERVLAAHGAERADLAIRVDGTPNGDATDVRVIVTRSTSDAAGLDRTYTLGSSDCASATELIALGVDRFLTSFPDWAGPAPERPPAPVPTRWIDGAIVAAASSMWRPFGVDAHAGATFDLGAERHRIGGSLIVRASVPQAAGSGSFQQTAVLAGATYRFRTGAWRFRGELRGGALLVSGIGLVENGRDVLPWWEAAVFGGRGFGFGTVGIEIAASALRHKAVTSDGLVSEDIPLLRLGFAGEFGIVSNR
jgi:hypothetical protein